MFKVCNYVCLLDYCIDLTTVSRANQRHFCQKFFKRTKIREKNHQWFLAYWVNSELGSCLSTSQKSTLSNHVRILNEDLKPNAVGKANGNIMYCLKEYVDPSVVTKIIFKKNQNDVA